MSTEKENLAVSVWDSASKNRKDKVGLNITKGRDAELLRTF